VVAPSTRIATGIGAPWRAPAASTVSRWSWKSSASPSSLNGAG
jgi:hypothetical protein